MKVLKIVLSLVAGIIALALIVALFVKGEYGGEREVVIDKPKDEVFTYLKFLKNQDNFSVWAQIDPAMKKEYKGTDGEVGFVSMWDSQDKNVGKGEQEIEAIKEGERIDYELRFIKPFEAKDKAYLLTESVKENPAQTKVKWGFKGKFNYPMNLMNLFMDMDAMLGKDLQSGLDKLKVILEKK